MNLIIRDMEESDIDSVYEIEKECFKTPWSKESIIIDFKNKDIAHYLVAENKGEILGYIGSWKVLDEGQITNIAVREKYRRAGIGKNLLSNLIDLLENRGVKTIVLEVRVKNESAINLYKKFGFDIVGKRPKYYTDNNEDAYIMVR
ncbi:MAG: ribosomal protein S18-alanine N-acetyltransferase [Andreesenia angusta]|nr:ribosomal protein S18-alanine N-acetyltransferase [Andreesenia angusta]